MEILGRRFFYFLTIPMCALMLIFCPPVAARSKNFRKTQAARVRRKARIKKTVPAAASAAAVKPREGLAAGRWDPAVKRALEDLLYEKGKNGAQYDAQKPPVAVFAWNDVVISGDPSEAVFFRLVERVDFKYDDDFCCAKN